MFARTNPTQATAFQLPLTTRPRPAGVLRPTSFSATPASRHEDPRPRVASLSMVVDGTKPGGAAPEAPTQDAAPAVDAAAPEGTDAPTDDVAHAAKDDTASVEGGKVGKIEGKEEVEKVVSAAPAVVAGAGVPAAVAAVPKAKPVVAKKKKEEEPTDVSTSSTKDKTFSGALVITIEAWYVLQLYAVQLDRVVGPFAVDVLLYFI